MISFNGTMAVIHALKVGIFRAIKKFYFFVVNEENNPPDVNA